LITRTGQGPESSVSGARLTQRSSRLSERSFIASRHPVDAVELVAPSARSGREEAIDLMLALKAGLPGTTSLHSREASEVLLKPCTLPLLAGENTGVLSAFRTA
jgi:hypothetical protein